jgi:hypothetical protein
LDNIVGIGLLNQAIIYPTTTGGVARDSVADCREVDRVEQAIIETVAIGTDFKPVARNAIESRNGDRATGGGDCNGGISPLGPDDDFVV